MAALALAALGGCGGAAGGPDAKDGGASSPSASPTVTAESPAPAERLPRWRRLRFPASDGVRLHGRYTPPRRPGAPAVVLVHQLAGGPRQWDPLIPALHRAGYATLAYASRSPGELDETVLARDVAGAVAAMRRKKGVDPDRVGLVGASIGATTVAWFIGRRAPAAVRAGVGLSPVESPALIAAGMRHRYRPRDLLLIADHREISNSRSIRTDGHGRGVRTWTAPAPGHGVALVPTAAVERTLLGWLAARLR